MRERQNIRAKLTPGGLRNRCRTTAYSMFGTDRRISSFELMIERLEREDEEERCTAWGSVSYTFEDDFRDETTDDSVVFHLYVRPERFSRYATKISAAEVDEAILRLSQVAGFYSDWSPAISTDEIKVLVSHNEQAIEVPQGCHILPPRLGKVREAELYLHRITKLEPGWSAQAHEDKRLEDEDESAKAAADTAWLAAQHSSNSNSQMVALLSSMRTAAWVIAALLMVLIVTR